MRGPRWRRRGPRSASLCPDHRKPELDRTFVASKFFRAASSGELWGQLAPPIQMSPEHLPGLRDARGKEDAFLPSWEERAAHSS